MKSSRLKVFPYVILNGFSKIKKASWINLIWRKAIGNRKLIYSKFVDLRINFAPDDINIASHPVLKSRLVRDFGSSLSSLTCTTGDFKLAMLENRVGLGHVWVEVYSLILDEISIRLGFDHIAIRERFKLVQKKDSHVVYRVEISTDQEFPYELVSGLEHLVNGYLNAILLERPFDIRKRITEYIDYRRWDN